MKKILIINKEQYGYHIDSYYYCKYLKKEFDITYISFDLKRENIITEGIEAIYINSNGSKIIKNLRFIISIIKNIKKNKYHLVFLIYFPGCSMITLWNKTRYSLDIRTGTITYNRIKRIILDNLLYFESLFFKNISIISQSLADKLKIKSSNMAILPLGSEIISSTKKKFDSLNLIYVGVFSYREIENTIKGIILLKSNKSFNKKIRYKIIGYGYNNEETILKNIVEKHNLSKEIEIIGPIHHNELKIYFDACNIGVVYIPVTEYYDCQPSTKLFEYLLSGMPVIATANKENMKIVNERNGIIIESNPAAFAQGLFDLSKKMKNYDSDDIRESVIHHRWKNIIDKRLKPYLDTVIKDKNEY